jgi:hypothetical protein
LLPAPAGFIGRGLLEVRPAPRVVEQLVCGIDEHLGGAWRGHADQHAVDLDGLSGLGVAVSAHHSS